MQYRTNEEMVIYSTINHDDNHGCGWDANKKRDSKNWVTTIKLKGTNMSMLTSFNLKNSIQECDYIGGNREKFNLYVNFSFIGLVVHLCVNKYTVR